MEKLQKLKELHEDGYLTDEEYSRRKNELIDAMLNADNEGGGAAPPARATTVSRGTTNPTRATVQGPPSSSHGRRESSDESSEEPYVPPPARTTSAAPSGGRVITVDAPPPSSTGRVIYVDVNAPKVNPVKTQPLQMTEDGRVICTRCGEPIATKVCEYDRRPYDSVCFRLVQVGGEEALRLPSTSIADSAPHRTYRNRKGERELAAIAKKNEDFDKKHRKDAINNQKKLEKIKEERRRQLAREEAQKAKAK